MDLSFLSLLYIFVSLSVRWRQKLENKTHADTQSRLTNTQGDHILQEPKH